MDARKVLLVLAQTVHVTEEDVGMWGVFFTQQYSRQRTKHRHSSDREVQCSESKSARWICRSYFLLRALRLFQSYGRTEFSIIRQCFRPRNTGGKANFHANFLSKLLPFFYCLLCENFHQQQQQVFRFHNHNSHSSCELFATSCVNEWGLGVKRFAASSNTRIVWLRVNRAVTITAVDSLNQLASN